MTFKFGNLTDKNVHKKLTHDHHMITFFLFCFSFSGFSQDKAVSLSVSAPWGEVRLVDQIFAFCKNYHSKMAKDFLTKVVENPEKAENEELLWEIVNKTIPNHLHQLLKADLNFGERIPASIFNGFSDSPNIQNEFHLYKTDFINIPNDADFNEVQKIKKNLKKNDVIYADIIKDAEKIHKMLKNDEVFVLRSTPPKIGNKSYLKGFGAQMRPFKYSMEYGIKNSDSNKYNQGQTKPFFDNTTKNIPIFSDMETNISAISFDNFDLKFASFMGQNKTNFLQHLRDVTSNWPLYLNQISKSAPESSYTSMIKKLYSPKRDHSFLNGNSVDLNSIDMFSLLHVINQEKILNDILIKDFGMNEQEAKLFFTEPIPNHDQFYFNFESDLIDYFNNIETDNEYKSWSTNINDLEHFTHQIPKIRKNLLHMILYLDPTTFKGANFIMEAVYLVTRMYPITFGVIPLFPMNNHLSRKLAFGYHHIAIRNPKQAIFFLVRALSYTNHELSANTEDPDPDDDSFYFTEKACARAYEEIARTLHSKTINWNNLNVLYTPKSEEYQKIKQIAKYYQNKNIDLYSLSINGVIRSITPEKKEYGLYIYQGFQDLLSLIHILNINSFEEISPYSILELLDSANRAILDEINNSVFSHSINALDVYNMNFEAQNDFINSFDNIEWLNQEKFPDTYMLLFTSSVSDDLDIFFKFIKESHQSKILFSLNPNIHFHNFDQDEYPAIIFNGRIMTNINLTSMNFFRDCDKWNHQYILSEISKFNAEEQNYNKKSVKQNFYMATLINSWRSRHIIRGEIDKNILFKEDNPLVYSSQLLKDELSWTIITNPFSSNMPKISSFLEYLDRNKIININLCLNPFFDNNSLSTLATITSYYRSSIDSNEIIFSCMNDTTTYSAIADVPSSWQVESLISPLDLDNILLSEINPGNYHAEYLLTNIIIEGTASTFLNNVQIFIDPPNYSSSSFYYNKMYSKTMGTTIMAPNGYFQLMGLIGPNIIHTSDLAGSNSVIEINSFNHAEIQIKVNDNKIDHQNHKTAGFHNTSRVDIFVVASGHLYERLTKIMMISVVTQTKSHVTFWFLNNFLSPQFKASLLKMSEKYKFDFEFVRYKWPEWLFKQTEKQRIIWGNKILFLDVLFPLSLERIIYIDADQVVRTDMSELMNMDFNGAPYAFTPFCDSREETEPFRFWKQGFWKKYLRNKKYHISALFAIDLVTFRNLGGGNIIRDGYQSLAPDGHSLANLDQDLPNVLQKNLPIFSLPQNWLWCETWCSDETMDEAKTIDLCNNPLTKKPKLEIAKSRIKEWPGLDEEAQKITASDEEYERLFFS